MNGKVLVITGALGALGKVVTETAVKRGARVAGIDHAPSQAATTPERSSLAASISPTPRRRRKRSTLRPHISARSMR